MTYLSKPVILVDGVALPSPAYGKYTTKKEELVKAERNVAVSDFFTDPAVQLKYGDVKNGELIKRHIAFKYTIQVEWTGLTYEEKTRIMTATETNPAREQGTGGLISRDLGLNVTFLDMDTDKMVTARMYRGTDQSVTGYGRFSWSGAGQYTRGRFEYYDVALSLIEL